MLNTNFSPWPSFSEEEIEAVSGVLRSNQVNYWTGEEGRKFESEFAVWGGCAHAIALANGTVALDLALKVLGIGPGDEVVVTPRSFMASVSCVAMAGARPVFADVDRDSQNISPESILKVLSPRTRAIICVHLAGWPCDMDGIMDIARTRGIFVIEDCAQAHGALYKGRPVGSIGHIGAWSFCQDKIMTTGGEGGMLTTNDHGWWEQAWSYKDHGKSWQAVYGQEHPPGFRWLHESFGTNWRMTEMQAAIGRIQLRRMEEWHAVRAKHARRLMAAAHRCPALRVPELPSGIEHAWYKCYMFVRPEALKPGWSRDRIMAEICSAGVPCFSGGCPEIYMEKAFEETDLRPRERMPVAKELGETSLMFLVHPTLRDDEMERACEVLQDVMGQATR